MGKVDEITPIKRMREDNRLLYISVASAAFQAFLPRESTTVHEDVDATFNAADAFIAEALRRLE